MLLGSSRHVMRIRSFFETPPLAIVSDYYPVTLRARMGRGHVATIRPMIRGILRGLAAVHAHGVAHLDIKPRNIMVRRSGEPVLIDFGLSEFLPAEQNEADQKQTAWYRAPEAAMRIAPCAAMDVWSVGCITFEMLFNRPFTPAQTNGELLNIIQRRCGALPLQEYVARCSPARLDKFCVVALDEKLYLRATKRDITPLHTLEALLVSDPVVLDLLQQMLLPDFCARPTAAELLKHSFFDSG